MKSSNKAFEMFEAKRKENNFPSFAMGDRPPLGETELCGGCGMDLPKDYKCQGTSCTHYLAQAKPDGQGVMLDANFQIVQVDLLKIKRTLMQKVFGFRNP